MTSTEIAILRKRAIGTGAKEKVPVYIGAVFDRREGRKHLIGIGLTIMEIVDGLKLTSDIRARVSVSLSRGGQTVLIPRAHWHRVKPKSGVKVVVTVAPGKDALRVVLQILVTVAAAWLASSIAPLFAAQGTTAFSVVKAGITAALVPAGGLFRLDGPIPPHRGY